MSHCAADDVAIVRAYESPDSSGMLLYCHIWTSKCLPRTLSHPYRNARSLHLSQRAARRLALRPRRRLVTLPKPRPLSNRRLLYPSQH